MDLKSLAGAQASTILASILTFTLNALILRKPCQGNRIPHANQFPGGQPRSKPLLYVGHTSLLCLLGVTARQVSDVTLSQKGGGGCCEKILRYPAQVDN